MLLLQPTFTTATITTRTSSLYTLTDFGVSVTYSLLLVKLFSFLQYNVHVCPVGFELDHSDLLSCSFLIFLLQQEEEEEERERYVNPSTTLLFPNTKYALCAVREVGSEEHKQHTED